MMKSKLKKMFVDCKFVFYTHTHTHTSYQITHYDMKNYGTHILFYNKQKKNYTKKISTLLLLISRILFIY